MSVNVWTSQGDIPGRICKDARLTDREKSLFLRNIATEDKLYGQAGWDLGINFLKISDLAGQLESLVLPNREPVKGKIRRLAINTHGNQGVIFINGLSDPVALTAKTVPSLKAHLVRIGLMTPDDSTNNAVILFVGCLAAQGKDGSDLLIELSKVWPNRKVVSFITLGYGPGGAMSRAGEQCTEPGMRDTTTTDPGGADKLAGKLWNDLSKWPWASENSPRAKVALNSKIIRGAQWD
jgi:hypothetical protein